AGARPLAPAAPRGTSPPDPRADLARREDALLRENRLDGEEPALVVRGPLVLVRGHALDAPAELVDVHRARAGERADERVREQLPVGELVLAPVDLLVGRPAAPVVHRPLHAAILAPGRNLLDQAGGANGARARPQRRSSAGGTRRRMFSASSNSSC